MTYDAVEFCGGPMDGLRLVDGIAPFAKVLDQQAISVQGSDARYKLSCVRDRVLYLECVSLG